jgi:hypothetical protein
MRRMRGARGRLLRVQANRAASHGTSPLCSLETIIPNPDLIADFGICNENAIREKRPPFGLRCGKPAVGKDRANQNPNSDLINPIRDPDRREDRRFPASPGAGLRFGQKLFREFGE